MFKREGFWRGSDQNPEAIVNDESEPGFEEFAQHTFESSGDLLENHDPEMLPLPAEQCHVIGEPKTLLEVVKSITGRASRVDGFCMKILITAGVRVLRRCEPWNQCPEFE